MIPERLAAELFSGPSRTFALRLWDGALLPPARDAGVRGTVVLRDPRALEAFLPPAAEGRLAEAYLDGLIELEGDAIALLEAATLWEGPTPRLAVAPSALRLVLRRALRRERPRLHEARLGGGMHSVLRDRDAVRHHYDVSDEFYALFLDRGMVYSCAFFPREGLPLEEAQRAKLDLVCRKLALREGERLLDVGCGWGALVERAAAGYGARALGITLSANQLGTARARVAALGDAAAIESADYRTLRAERPFDKIASVGMMEHVGRARLAEYLSAMHRLLRPGGLLLNHAIADASGGRTALRWARARRGGGFIDRYVFPDGELLPIGEVVSAAERAGFEVRDLESLREHYAETLARWLARLEARWSEAVAMVGERRARVYRLYLAASAAGFRVGRISVFQLLLARRTAAGRAEGLPRNRGEWYSERVELRDRPAGIVLAAGSARRMGTNKLLLEVGGESLVRRAVRAAREGGLDPVLVVVGHEAERVRAELAGLPCEIVPNPRHALGMGTSLDAGVAAVPAGAPAAVVLLADMPLVRPAMVRELVARHRASGAPIVSSRYGGVAAPPTLYARALFPELRGGEGEGRGREVVKRHAGEAAFVDWPASALADVDEAEDLERAKAGLGVEAR